MEAVKNEEQLWTVDDVSKFLKLTKSAIYQKVDEGWFGDSVKILFQGDRKRTIRFIPHKVKAIVGIK